LAEVYFSLMMPKSL